MRKMNYLDIIKYNNDKDGILTTPSLPIEGELSPSERSKLIDMERYVKSRFTYPRLLKRNKPVGLAAPQIGINKRMFVFKGNKGEFAMEDGVWATKDRYFSLYNPEIIIKSFVNTYPLEESCLSVTTKYKGSVSRYFSIVLKGFDVNGVKITIKCINNTSRRVQHEIDHLNGILYFNRLSYFTDKKKFSIPTLIAGTLIGAVITYIALLLILFAGSA